MVSVSEVDSVKVGFGVGAMSGVDFADMAILTDSERERGCSFNEGWDICIPRGDHDWTLFHGFHVDQ